MDTCEFAPGVEVDLARCRLFAGGTVRVVLDDRVLPDRTCGQWDTGWWAFGYDPGTRNLGADYFLSTDNGVLYGKNAADGDRLTLAVGVCPELAREARERDAKMAADEEALFGREGA